MLGYDNTRVSVNSDQRLITVNIFVVVTTDGKVIGNASLPNVRLFMAPPCPINSVCIYSPKPTLLSFHISAHKVFPPHPHPWAHLSTPSFLCTVSKRPLHLEVDRRHEGEQASAEHPKQACASVGLGGGSVGRRDCSHPHVYCSWASRRVGWP